MAIDDVSREAVARATAKVVCGVRSGTGYLIAPDQLVTSDTIIGDAPIECTFGDGRERRSATVVQRAANIAVLALALPLSVEALKVGAAPSTGQAWIYGYPASGLGAWFEALIVTDTRPADARELAVLCAQMSGAAGQSLAGLAGSPVLIGSTVIGHVASIARDTGEVHATNGRDICALLGFPAKETTRAPAAVVDPRTLRAVAEVKAAMTEGDVIAALGRCPREIADTVAVHAGERLLELALPEAVIRVLDPVTASPQRDKHLAVAYSLVGENARAAALIAGISGKERGDALAMLGGIHKRRWQETKNRRWLEAALAAYEEGYRVSGNHYPGVNEAFCLLALGRGDASRKRANELVATLGPEDAEDKWVSASYAEALLLIGKVDEARVAYTRAAARLDADPRSTGVMRRQARCVLELMRQPRGLFDGVFGVPAVAAFTGHRVDTDERRGRFPPSREGAVKAAISEVLASRNVQYGFSSAASGSDILFLEAMLDREGEARVFLPFPQAAFEQASIDPGWGRRFHEVLRRARVTILSDSVPPEGVERDAAYAACNDAIAAAAREQAKLLDEPPIMIAVVSNESTSQLGGAHDALLRWKNRGDAALVIPSRGAEPPASSRGFVWLDVQRAKAAYRVKLTTSFGAPVARWHDVTLPDEIEESLSARTLSRNASDVAALTATLQAKFPPPELRDRLLGAGDLPVYVHHDEDSARIPFELCFAAPNTCVCRTLVAVAADVATPRAIPETPRVLLVVDPRGNLPKARAEAQAIQRELGAERVEVLLGGAATVTAVRDMLPRFDIVHYSGHANASGLGLADGTFGASDLPTGAGGPTLVILNACETAAIDTDHRTLTHAFLESGVRAFVGTGWALPDSSAARLGRRFLVRVLDGIPVGRALATAIRELRDQEFDDTWFYYRLFGDPALAFAGNSIVSPSVRVP